MPHTELLKDLSSLIGQSAVVEGKPLTVVEILPDAPALVLQDVTHQKNHFQENQYGETGRRVGKTYTVSLWNEAGDSIHPAIVPFVTPALQERLLRYLP
ncbi:MAG: hypothetical protein ACWA5X_13465 [bacterium]